MIHMEVFPNRIFLFHLWKLFRFPMKRYILVVGRENFTMTTIVVKNELV